MAGLNLMALPQDPLHETAVTKRKFGRSLRGEFALSRELEQHRTSTFLSRNMTHVLAFHEKNRDNQSEYCKDSHVNISRHTGPYLGNGIMSSKYSTTDQSVSKSQDDIPSTPRSSQTKATSEQSISRPATPDIESMSSSCLKVKTSMESFDMPQRRSRRTQLVRQHEDKNAQLSFDISNVRKKLNFKDHKIDDLRPIKRPRTEPVECHCHITIWDNRQGGQQMDPIIRKSEVCRVNTSSLSDGTYYSEIRLDNPFTFKARELRVPIDGPQGSSLGMSSSYFLEIKIIPTKTDADWPPIPILGPSEGDRLNGLGQLAAEKLQGALVARYLHLPQAPEPDTPLGVFFLRDGRTHRTKYGMEVIAAWTRGNPDLKVKRESDVDSVESWAVDEKNQPFGRRNSEALVKTRTITDKPVISPVPQVEITYILDPQGSSLAASKVYRNASVQGYRCPACANQSFTNLDELQFHFVTIHSKYKFVIDPSKRIVSPITGDLISVSIKVISPPLLKSRNSERNRNGEEENWNWIAPEEPFNLSKFVEGDRSWAGEHVNKKVSTPITTSVSTRDELSELRQSLGFLPAEKVGSFRQASRKKYNNIKLNTITVERSVMYTSVSHRRVSLSEEPRSESDDDMDDEWFVQKSLESLDVMAEKHEWSEEDRFLRREWAKARLAEKLSHPRYLSDGLIRFIRARRNLPIFRTTKLKFALANLLEELLDRHVINKEVIRDVWDLLHPDLLRQGQNINSSLSEAERNWLSRNRTVKDQILNRLSEVLRTMVRHHTINDGRSQETISTLETHMAPPAQTFDTDGEDVVMQDMIVGNNNDDGTSILSDILRKSARIFLAQLPDWRVVTTEGGPEKAFSIIYELLAEPTESLTEKDDIDEDKTSQQAFGLPRRERVKALLALPDYVCGACNQDLDHMDRRVIRCCEVTCEAPAVLYHGKCARCKVRDKLSWKCPICVERDTESMSKDKGKEHSME